MMIRTPDIPLAAFEGLFRTKDTYLVGGCVRDILLNRRPTDYDIVCLNHPQRFAEHIASRTGGHLVALGKPDKMIYRVVSAQRTFDIAPVVGASIEADLQHRDFTINAMACNLQNGRIIDVTGGRHDLQTGCIRMVSERALETDTVRLLRAYRIAAVLNFDIEDRTVAAIRRHAPRIAEAAGERIRDEFMKLFGAPRTSHYLSQMAQSRLIFEIIPELRHLEGCRQNRHHHYDVWRHTLAACHQLEYMLNTASILAPDLRHVTDRIKNASDAWLLKFSLLLHDIAKPAVRSQKNGRDVHFYGHAYQSAKIARRITARLRFSAAECNRIAFLVDSHMRPLQLFLLERHRKLTAGAIARFFFYCGHKAPEVLLLSIADHLGKDRPKPLAATDFFTFATGLMQRYFDEISPRMRQVPLINGHDLIHELDLPPSPLFKKILDGICQARLAGTVTDRQTALDLARKIVASATSPPAA